MHYVENGDPSNPLLLLVHGFPEFWFSWRHQLRGRLAQHFRVVAVDLRGYGDSDKPCGVQHYRLSLVVDDLREAIEALGYSSCCVVGHDLGGAAAWTLAARHPETVRRLAILNSPHPLALSMYTRSHRSQFFKSWYTFFFQLPWFPEWLIGRQDLATIEESLTGKSQGVRRGMITSEEMEAYKFSLCEPGAISGPVNHFRAAARQPNDWEQSQRSATIEAPVLVVFGSRDRFVCEDAARLSRRFCRSFEMRTVPEASHWVQQDAPDLVDDLLLEFLAPELVGEMQN